MLFGRRVRFTIVVLASHLLLLALAIAWLIQMLIIAQNGSVQFIENNPSVLLAEIIVTSLISLFAIIIFVLQIRRLGERREGEKQRRSDMTVAQK